MKIQLVCTKVVSLVSLRLTTYQERHTAFRFADFYNVRRLIPNSSSLQCKTNCIENRQYLLPRWTNPVWNGNCLRQLHTCQSLCSSDSGGNNKTNKDLDHISTDSEDSKVRRNRTNKITCDICSKSFTSNSKLTRHMRTHTGEKPYTCAICNTSFSHKCNLKTHMRTHTGEKPYICEVCNKSFSRKDSLTTHLRTHAGEKPYTCEVCGTSFSQKSNLTAHMRIHTGEKPYICEVCNKPFSHKSNLTVHMRTHTREKPYTCEVCNVSFRQKAHLKQHEKTHKDC